MPFASPVDDASVLGGSDAHCDEERQEKYVNCIPHYLPGKGGEVGERPEEEGG